MAYPKKVFFREEGPREGFQIHPEVIPTEKKLSLINALVEAGARDIETTSFVRPDKVPQHADANEVAKGLKPAKGVRYRGLYLNQKGFELASAHSSLQPEGCLTLASNDAFLQKNCGRTISQTLEQLDSWIELFASKGQEIERLMLSCAFGDKGTGKIPSEVSLEIVRRTLSALEDLSELYGREIALPEVTFADTTGYGTPASINDLLSKSLSLWPTLKVSLHLHDTRGTGMANVLEALKLGIDTFDCTVAGLGGCPFTEGAAGNVPTEDVAFMCQELGIEIDLDLEKYIGVAKLAEDILSKKLPGKLKASGLF